MRVIPVSHSLDLLKSDLVRSPGVHASDIYGDLYKELYPKRYDFGDAPPNLVSVGTTVPGNRYHVMPQNDDCTKALVLRDGIISVRK